ncbi:MAG: glycosyltransferase family 4 protein [Euryarchaeota archaeon]|jgi:glycosyltransferase involved in cell wall biosynthesis|nr:glycosyltransferase family 4 protein [Euryarchaeota archaeon]
MRRVVHVGPTMAPGGMASVIHLLAAKPPDGWRGSSCNTYSTKGLRRKIKRWRIAKKQIKTGDFDLVHIHCASDWSYRRKISIAKVANCPVIFHIHSGKFDIDTKSDLDEYQVVCLSEGWSEKLHPLIGDSIAVPNPVDAQLKDGVERENFTLLMGRNDPVKGHKFAYSLDLDDLRVTGVDSAPEGVTALGWVTEEEKWNLLQTAGVLIVPSEYEGQPMVILEALAAGCPVIASENVPDLPSCVKTATLGDIDSWKSAINNPVTENLEEAISEHLIENVRRQWGEIYDNIIDSKTSTE